MGSEARIVIVDGVGADETSRVLEKADLSGTGTMRPEEVLPAIAVWKDLAEKKSSAVCVIA